MLRRTGFQAAPDARLPTNLFVRTLMDSSGRRRLAATLTAAATARDDFRALGPAQPHRPGCRQSFGVAAVLFVCDFGSPVKHRLASRNEVM
jgi:hypothetical protein